MSGRIASQHLAAAYDGQVRLAWRAMHDHRRKNRHGDAAFCRDRLNALLQVRKDAREFYVSAPNPSTVAWRREQAEANDIRADDNRMYLADQMAGIRRVMR